MVNAHRPAFLHLNLHREFFAQMAAGMKRIEQGAPVTAPGLPPNSLESQSLVTGVWSWPS
jgi:hypothetical protein